MEKFIRLAKLQADKVDLEGKKTTFYRLGAVVFRKNRVINVGHNSYSTHPKSNAIAKNNQSKKPTFSIHAEFAALLGCNRLELNRASILVVRIGAYRNLLMARPCAACFNLIRAANIRNVFYSNEFGQIIKERV